MVDLAQQGIDLKQRDVERKSALVKSNVGSQLDLDNAGTALVTAQLRRRNSSSSRSRTPGPSCSATPICRSNNFRPTAQAKAALDDAERNLDHTVMRAPMAASRRRSTRSSSAAS